MISCGRPRWVRTCTRRPFFAHHYPQRLVVSHSREDLSSFGSFPKEGGRVPICGASLASSPRERFGPQPIFSSRRQTAHVGLVAVENQGRHGDSHINEGVRFPQEDGEKRHRERGENRAQ